VSIADDSALIRELLVRVLTDAGCEIVGEAGDAEELLAAVRRDPPDVVVTDIRMPPGHANEGLLAALSIRSEFPNVGVLVLPQFPVGIMYTVDFGADGRNEKRRHRLHTKGSPPSERVILETEKMSASTTSR
jgi:DNA-binding NarL/FixJ family response regulator